MLGHMLRQNVLFRNPDLVMMGEYSFTYVLLPHSLVFLSGNKHYHVYHLEMHAFFRVTYSVPVGAQFSCLPEVSLGAS